MLPASFAFGESADHKLLLRPGFNLEPIGAPFSRPIDTLFALGHDAFHAFCFGKIEERLALTLDKNSQAGMPATGLTIDSSTARRSMSVFPVTSASLAQSISKTKYSVGAVGCFWNLCSSWNRGMPFSSTATISPSRTLERSLSRDTAFEIAGNFCSSGTAVTRPEIRFAGSVEDRNGSIAVQLDFKYPISQNGTAL
jgi:hypothetical protein